MDKTGADFDAEMLLERSMKNLRYLLRDLRIIKEDYRPKLFDIRKFSRAWREYDKNKGYVYVARFERTLAMLKIIRDIRLYSSEIETIADKYS